jgi:hypothetical protein
VIGRFSSEAAYDAYLISTANLDYRRGVHASAAKATCSGCWNPAASQLRSCARSAGGSARTTPPRDGVETVEADLLPVDIYGDLQAA